MNRPPFQFRPPLAPAPKKSPQLQQNQPQQQQPPPKRKNSSSKWPSKCPEAANMAVKVIKVESKPIASGILFSPPSLDLSKVRQFGLQAKLLTALPTAPVPKNTFATNSRTCEPSASSPATASVQPQGLINLQASTAFNKAPPAEQSPSPPSPEVSSVSGGNSGDTPPPHRSHYQQKHQYFTLRKPSASLSDGPPIGLSTVAAPKGSASTVMTIKSPTPIRAPTPMLPRIVPIAATVQVPKPETSPPLKPVPSAAAVAATPSPPKTSKDDVIPWILEKDNCPDDYRTYELDRLMSIVEGSDAPSKVDDSPAKRRPFKRPLLPAMMTNKSSSSSSSKIRKKAVIEIGKNDLLETLGSSNSGDNNPPLPPTFNHKSPFKSSPLTDVDTVALLELDEHFTLD